MTQNELDLCFCTLAFGDTYRSLAKELAKDLEQYAPDVPFVLFTDKVSEFKAHKNVLAFGHRRRGVLLYHERRFAIAKALTMANSCMYLDADVRICAPVPRNIQWLPGLTARSCSSMNKHIRERLNKTDPPDPKAVKVVETYKKMAHKVGVDPEDDQIRFINEFLFVITKDSGREIEFLDLWGRLALYAELLGMHKHPTYAMGLAAVKTGLHIRHDVMEGLDFFDDRIEKVRIANGQSDPAAKQKYFETQQKVEQRYRSLPHKAIDKISRFFRHHYHTTRLKITTYVSDSNFYHH
ncbi:hypothetical protein H6F88_15720 [Oculatella sp. FACHB-28]|uniref:hypothetical protein n=1 Tax=Oculatella sp. FACHB-28 TaxID=2692845 RepID=UPI00168530F1|nr:hypothetical protein [Oculatella sp. FACHB-28]MBD2057451.1 hypothetical protein [Oculatella sp. FACHB-28]